MCARWRVVVDRSVEQLRLSKAKIHNVIAQFPSVKHIDMSGGSAGAGGLPAANKLLKAWRMERGFCSIYGV